MKADVAPLLELRDLSCGYSRDAVLSGIDFAMRKGELVALLGPNGAGKTTLFKTILRLQPALAGRIRIHGEDVSSWPVRRFAKAVGYVPQVHTPPFPFSVIDVVAMGRACHLGPFAEPSSADRDKSERALDILSVGHLRDRVYTELSGGERQLVLVARALTQEPDLLVLDEPTYNLDFGNQLAVLDHIQRLVAQEGLGVIMTTHDPNQALGYATTVLALDRRGALRAGTPRALITEDYIRETYNTAVRILRTEQDGQHRHYCLPVRRHHHTGAEAKSCLSA